MKFGIVTDLHLDAESAQALERSSAVAKIADIGLDFIVNLGDLGDANDKTIRNSVRSFFESTGCPTHHVIGNHDLDTATKNEFKNAFAPEHPKSYYSFDYEKTRFLILDLNYHPDGADFAPGNFTWQNAFMPREEVEWLKHDLEEAGESIVCFCHQNLDPMDCGVEIFATNHEEIKQTLLESGKNITVFQGHAHGAIEKNVENLNMRTLATSLVNDTLHLSILTSSKFEKANSIDIKLPIQHSI
jgi:3',5'-cyclic AMP phosphodiesterase CpdA